MKLLSALFTFLFLTVPQQAHSQAMIQAKPWMGIMIETKANEGVKINDVVPGTPAFKAGLKAEDLVKKIDDTQMTDVRQMIAYIQSRGVGNDVKVEFVRAGKVETLTLKLEAKPDELELIRKSLVGKKAPDFKLEVLGAKDPIESKDIAGKVTVVEFWATWCPACISSHGRLSKFAVEHPEIKVLAVSDEELPALTSYAAQAKPKFQIIRDEKKDFVKHFMVSAIPMTVVIDKGGLISFATLGAGSYLEEALNHAVDTAGKK